MITYTEKGYGLHQAIAAAGHSLSQVDGVWIASDEAAVQAIIDAFDPLPPARDEARIAIDEAAERARLRYITPGAGQAATYQIKEAQARQYLADGTVGILLRLEAQATGASVAEVSALIVATAEQWIGLAALIEARRMGAKAAVGAEIDWRQCAVIAAQAVAELDGM